MGITRLLESVLATPGNPPVNGIHTTLGICAVYEQDPSIPRILQEAARAHGPRWVLVGTVLVLFVVLRARPRY